MTRQDVQIGIRYTDRRGNVRIVLDIEQAKNGVDVVEYKLIQRVTSKSPLGSIGFSSRKAFAEWARELAERE